MVASSSSIMFTANRSDMSVPSAHARNAGTSQIVTRVHVVAALAVSLAAVSCVVQGARASGMATLTDPIPSMLPGRPAAGVIVVESVDGGRETNALSRSYVSSDQLKRALEMSLQRSGYLAPDSARAGIAMRATLVRLGEPKGWLTYSVSSVV